MRLPWWGGAIILLAAAVAFLPEFGAALALVVAILKWVVIAVAVFVCIVLAAQAGWIRWAWTDRIVDFVERFKAQSALVRAELEDRDRDPRREDPG